MRVKSSFKFKIGEKIPKSLKSIRQNIVQLGITCMHTCWILIDPTQKRCNDHVHVRVSFFFSLLIHQATYEYLQSSNLLVATCSMFRIVFSQLMNTFLHTMPWPVWGKKNNGESRNKIYYDRTCGDSDGRHEFVLQGPGEKLVNIFFFIF